MGLSDVPSVEKWHEERDLREMKYVRDVMLYESRAYINTDTSRIHEFGMAINCLEYGVVLKIVETKEYDGRKYSYNFLKMENGSWIRGIVNHMYKVQIKFKGENERVEEVVIILTLETDDGFKKRILRKKLI